MGAEGTTLGEILKMDLLAHDQMVPRVIGACHSRVQSYAHSVPLQLARLQHQQCGGAASSSWLDSNLSVAAQCRERQSTLSPCNGYGQGILPRRRNVHALMSS